MTVIEREVFGDWEFVLLAEGERYYGLQCSTDDYADQQFGHTCYLDTFTTLIPNSAPQWIEIPDGYIELMIRHQILDRPLEPGYKWAIGQSHELHGETLDLNHICSHPESYFIRSRL